MERDYYKKVTTLLEQAHPLPPTRLGFKNVFGAVGGYVDGRIFISCGKFGVALRLPDKTLAHLFREKDVKHLKYFAKGHIKKEYAVLPERMLRDGRRLRKLLDESIRYVSSVTR